MMLLAATSLQAQITIGGHVYGGGNAGNTGGNTTVTVRAGDLNRVFGGARMADVSGRAFVNIDGAHASNYIIINRLYGGNDIAGTIGTSDVDLPAVVADHAVTNGVDKTWNALVLISSKIITPATYYTAEDQEVIDGNKKVGDIKTPAIVAEDNKPIYIGQLFGGGDGEYKYGSRIEDANTVYFAKEDGVEVAKSTTALTVPNIGKTFVDIHGGSIVYAYGGGNNATVTEKTVISLDNPSKVVNSIKDTRITTEGEGELLTNDRFENQMGINTTFSYPSSDAFQIGRLFGGNNKADMAIRPRWNLQRGSVRNLYGGGNEGRMTTQEGLLMEIKGAGMKVDNVYGGCRKADVKPLFNNNDETPVPYNQIALDPADNPNNIPAGYAARVRVTAGHVNNVYGGNDISGNVYGGNTVGIMTHIYGDVYGAGNGSYAYTDNEKLKDDPRWSDFYYNPDAVLTAAGITDVPDKLKSVTALNLIRPNAEKVSILVRGEENNPTIVDGSLYVGGNSASLRENISGSSAGNQTHIKIGSHVIIDNVFLGNNGANMVKTDGTEVFDRNEGVLRTITRTFKDSENNDAKFSTMDLTDADVFAKYMEGCAMKEKSTVVFESTQNGDGVDYIPYSSYFGSFYCGGNVGSMITSGKTTIDFNHQVIIYDKLVGGCNNANVYQSTYNAEYLGGMLGDPDSAPEGAIGDKLELNLSGLKIQPKRWKNPDDKSQGLEWNTISAGTGLNVPPVTAFADENQTTETADANDVDRRLKGGNIYGGCYNSGHVNGNVIININETLMERDKLFDVASNEGDILYENPVSETGKYTITKRNTGVILSEQGMDVLGSALNVFGGGFGGDSEIWGSTTINLNKGYTFQIFGGGEAGAIGKAVSHVQDPNNPTAHILTYEYNPKYSTYINLNGEASLPGVARGAAGDSPDMAECEFIYGGGFEGVIAGNTHINLGNGRIFNSFAGSCNADIYGHTETYVGRKKKSDGTYEDGGGFPWIRDHIYGGNDLGGRILGEANFSGRIRDDVSGMVAEAYQAQVKKATTYMEYTQGRVRNILGGCFGDYDYTLDKYSVKESDDDADYKVACKPYLHNAFVNFRPNTNANNAVEKIFGAGEGCSGDRDGDKGQDHSYVLIDIPDNVEKFANTEVFGAGAFNGLGMRYPAADTFVKGETPFDLNEASAIIDLMRGKIGAAYGGSYEEGVTRRTVVNVPLGSTIKIGSIFGGAYGSGAYKPCDVYEANVNYLTKSEDAYLISDPTGTNKLMKGAIYGGNNYARRTLYGKINISARVRQKHPTYGMTTATVYGAGCGSLTWNEYTEVNLNADANVWEVYGGGEAGGVMSAESVQKYIALNPDGIENFTAAWTLGSGYDPASFADYATNTYTNLTNSLVRQAEIDDRELTEEQKTKIYKKYNTNVLIKEGAYVGNYAYGGGLGNANDAFKGSGDVYGTTYIALLGGTVGKDIYAAGTSGSVYNLFGADNFTASANAYIKGGTVRNVYGGGWRGSVGYHKGAIGNVDNNTSDKDGEVHVVVGDLDGISQTSGIPSITRNVYGGGEGGAIYGDAYVKMNKGYVGYRYNSAGSDDNKTVGFDEHYEPELDDAVVGDNKLDQGGNIFGGGYVANSYVDRSHVTMMGGIVRGSLYGGGEIGPIGRGTVHTDSIAKYSGSVKNGAAIYKGGETHVYLWDGHVMRDVFGGGRGYDNWGGEGYMTDEEKETMDKSSKGYVFGSTDVHIYGGEVGTETNVLKGYGNVFGGGNEGFVYSATGTKNNSDGYYWNSNSKLSEDCKIAVEPQCKVIADIGVTIGGTAYAKGAYVPVEELNKLQSRAHKEDSLKWLKLDTRGIVIHNSLFAGGNITEGSDKIFANTITVYGNAAASLRDVYNFDLISLGTEEMGGLYGDGNLTLVDGFRELHIDNYGTDYYSLRKTMLLSEYEKLTTRQQAYYKLKYGANSTHTYNYYESKQLHTYKYTDSEGYHEVSYRKGQKVTSDTYNNFSSDEKGYWTLGSKSYQKDEQIEEGEYSLMDGEENETTGAKTGEKANWTLLGVTSIYAGRPMNTIQRADFCGVFGSRMVMKGAVDRAPQVNGGVDYNSYTINRVDEVSLNQRISIAPGDASSNVDKEHGNYFGIYNSVKFLGNLTSDVEFGAVRKTDTNIDAIKEDDTTTYYQWKLERPQNKYRNNGISQNKVALASGVYLELKKEETETAGEDKWGYITGIIELDLINVMPGMGGGYVYAKNEHGTPSQVDNVKKLSLLSYNEHAKTYRQFTYSSPSDQANLKAIETSGNFVHNTKQIVDDCYPNGGIYKDQYVASPAHYWFIRGSIYVYEQYISAFTGSATATAEKQEIPLTITAASNGRMTLRDVQPNYYAYYDKGGNKLGSENADSVFVVNNVSYKLNQAISNWEYSLLSEGDQAKFVDKTYIVAEDCKIGETEYKKGTVMLESEYNSLKNSHPIKYMEGDEEKTDGEFNYFFRSSNNLSHNTGYVLTYDVNNPMVWNNYYTKTSSPGQANALNTKQYNELASGKNDYTEGPTYTLRSGVANAVFGQQEYNKGSILYGSVVNNYNTNVKSHLASTEGQAQVEQAYVLTTDYTLKNASGEVVQELTAGTPVYKSKYYNPESSLDLWTGKLATVTELAKVCTSLLEFTTTDYVYAGQMLTTADINELKAKVKAKNTGWTDDQAMSYLNSYLDDAYYCTSEGKYGGIYFETGKAYRAIDTWCSMTAAERANFDFNYDALDLLIDPDFSDPYGNKVKYDGTNTNKVYSSTQPIDYQAEFVGYVGDNSQEVTSITYTPKTGSAVTIEKSTSQTDWLSREAYEAIPNEKRHYSPIIITAPGDYYMVKTPFMDGEVPYTIGQQIDKETYDNLGSVKQVYIDVIKFEEAQTQKTNDVYDTKTYYYCRNNYFIDEKGEGKAVTTIAVTKNSTSVSSTTYNKDDEVPQGVVINETTYDGLCNFQKGFVVHGTSPTEVSTLYVSNESDINDLSAEKIITVVYLYEYDESDESGLNVTPVSERHIMNIHINFKSGVPVIGEINKPDLVLPGTTLGMNIPSVTQGAFRVTESGWEIFSNDDDAATHYNGTPFFNNETPLYWYQNNYWIAYYAQTSLGRTYSNSVKLNVANYHDLKKVMDDKDHHYYIDHKDVDRQPKIYINDYSGSGENGLDLFKNLIDLTNGHALTGHTALNLNNSGKPMRGGQYLEFFLKSDLSHPDTEAAGEWTPIANAEGECFSGNFHGDGHTISGLDNSLFNHLCGNVYNLGVTGSFTGAGIAETGGGYVENCWISTSSTAAKTSKPVFGTPTDLNSDRPYRIVNCYYQEDDNATNKYTNHSSTYGIPTRKDAKAFYNGEVAYDLNGFYLYKRYSDRKETSGTSYQCYHMKADGTALELKTKYYGAYNTTTAPLCSFGYVENRYEDGDFRYAEGSIPSSEEKRAYTVTDANNNEVTRYAPIWPDDYLFFGQSLTYDYGSAHQSQPSAIKKSEGRLMDGEASNRVYRAPAYYGSKDMGVAHFNPVAILATTSNPEAGTPVKEAYPGMTAIDFAGHNDAKKGTSSYKLGMNDATHFYEPLLDDGGLSSINNVDETRNLLVYSPAGTGDYANLATFNVLNNYFAEPAYGNYALNDGYGNVAIVTTPVFGHLVKSNLKTTSDHLLVDKQDFNCPIAYTMGEGQRMWYQRTPDNFVTIESGVTKGWEDISLPFKVIFVATQQKGEITHFYAGNTKGHEYWLRHYDGNLQQKKENGVDVPHVYTADFNLLAANGTDNKAYSNTFLWDYYYSKNDRDDRNGDDYKQYYNTNHTYENYPLEQAGKAYLIGFPGKSYYEFDLSGLWTAQNTASPAPAKLDKQTITFVSATGETINVSDTELSNGKTVKDGYVYVPNYSNKKFTTAGESYVMNANGDSYVKNVADAIVGAFRPYMVKAETIAGTRGDSKNVKDAEQIEFDIKETQFKPEEKTERFDGTLNIYGKKGKIVVQSSLRYTVEVSIYTPAGVKLFAFPVPAGETVEQRVNSKGVYIVNSDDGQHVKKVIVN